MGLPVAAGAAGGATTAQYIQAGAAAGSAGIDAAANIINAVGVYKTRKMQQEMFDRTMAYNIGMANTAHQREVEDLKKAGLNPILSAMGGSGAATPAVSAPTLTAPRYDPKAMATMESMLNLKFLKERVNSELINQKATSAKEQETLANTDLLKTLEKKAQADTSNSAAQARVAKMQAEKEEFIKSWYKPANEILQPVLKGTQNFIQGMKNQWHGKEWDGKLHFQNKK